MGAGMTRGCTSTVTQTCISTSECISTCILGFVLMLLMSSSFGIVFFFFSQLPAICSLEATFKELENICFLISFHFFLGTSHYFLLWVALPCCLHVAVISSLFLQRNRSIQKTARTFLNTPAIIHDFSAAIKL